MLNTIYYMPQQVHTLMSGPGIFQRMQEQDSSILVQMLLKKERLTLTFIITVSIKNCDKIHHICSMSYTSNYIPQMILFLEWILTFRILQMKHDTSTLPYQLEALEAFL